jgi:hypothetical protein
MDEPARARSGYLIAKGEHTSTIVPLFVGKAPIRWMHRLPSCATIYLIERKEQRPIGDNSVF